MENLQILIKAELSGQFNKVREVVDDLTYIPVLEKAEIIAKLAFSGKVDKAGKPYFEHLKRVSESVKDYGFRYQAVAILHDILEDCKEINYSDLTKLFPEEIVESVESMTHFLGETYERYIDRISKDPVAVKVKMADLRDNMDLSRLHEITEKDIQRLNKYQKAYDKLALIQYDITVPTDEMIINALEKQVKENGFKITGYGNL